MLCLVLLILLQLSDLPVMPIILGHPWLVSPTQRPLCGVGRCNFQHVWSGLLDHHRLPPLLLMKCPHNVS